MSNPLQQLHDFGQSFWYDNIRRELLRNGELARMVREDGLRGLTSNPTIFAKALASGSDYDTSIRRYCGRPVADVFLELMIEDIQGACDVLRPVYDSSQGEDGYASIEVFPGLARDSQGTIQQARMLWQRVARPNVMVKIPATPECLPAIASCLEEGININITLMFGYANYQAVSQVYVAALEKRAAKSLSVFPPASVASLFVSRVDTKLDPQLSAHPELQGKAGIANARRMYRLFEQTFSGPRWDRLAAQGARPQRLLWASTSTKNPKYPDTLYADALIGRHTVDTMPDATVAAFRDHGHVQDALAEAMAKYAAEVEPTLRGLEGAGIDLEQVALELQNEGVASFQKSYDELTAGLQHKVSYLSLQIGGPEPLRSQAQTAARVGAGWPGSIWKRDASLWSADLGVQAKIANRLGWLDLPATMAKASVGIRKFTRDCAAAGLTDAVLLGMGGSSLAPEVYSLVFADAGGMRLHVLDTTNPDQILAVEDRLDLKKTLFIVSSKSGGTIEPNRLFDYFWGKCSDGAHFIAITDDGTALQKLAAAHNFRHVFVNPGDIGGRYSALSYFGLVPAALVGVDVDQLLDRAAAMAEACRGADNNPGLDLGAALGTWALAGHDKLTLSAGGGLNSVGSWLEQLVAESTGKLGKGIVPVDGEALGPDSIYGADRVFVSLNLAGAPADGAIAALSARSPAVQIQLRDRYDLGAEFFRWEFAIAVAGKVMGINPFDEPNVQESKDNSVRVIEQFVAGGAAGAGLNAAPSARTAGLALFAPDARPGASAKALLDSWMQSIRPGDYVALMAYLPRDNANQTALEQLRLQIRDRFHVATTLGFGPRFLHSTGQLHKGGANIGVFLQITAAPAADAAIPGQTYGFATLLAAQALGDYQSLQRHQRRLLRVDLGASLASGLKALSAACAGAPAVRK